MSGRVPAATTGALRVPLVFTAGLAAFAFLPQIQNQPILLASFAGATAVLAVWLGLLWTNARRAGRRLVIEVSLRPQHYLQAVAHTMIFVYWGMYWPPIREAAPLIAAQIVFAYAFDMLLTWSRKDTFVLGFGPFPIIYSTNLFLRFRDDWFYLQFLMVAVGFLAKELIRWNREGRRVHIFNPSSFPLALFSLGLILTGTTQITWGEEIASLLFLPPHIYLLIFLVALPGQYLFRVTTMTLPAVLTTYLFSLIYLNVTGTYFFFDSNVPIAVFLGMHLLFTDPSTAPRTELGRIIFGVLYGLSVVALYAVLGWAGVPTFYDKLLQVPLMNLMVRAIDRFAESKSLAWLNPARLAPRAPLRMRGLAYVTLWIIAFGAMSAANGVGDSHPGHTVPFWESACRKGRIDGCRNLASIHARYCVSGSAWSCNELGIMGARGLASTPPPSDLFQSACVMGMRAGCENGATFPAAPDKVRHDDPGLGDYALVLQEGKGPLPDRTPVSLFTRACDQGWMAGCGRLALSYLQDQKPPDLKRAAALWERACGSNHAPSCSNLGLMHNNGDGVAKDRVKGLAYLKQACDLGMANACRWLTEQTAQP